MTSPSAAPDVALAVPPVADRRATLWGLGAIALWTTVAATTTLVAAVPPLQLTAMTFGVSAAVAFTKWIVRGESISARLAQPWAAWVVGAGGLFGYHVLYFVALRKAPPAEANVINYLWPLLIVLFSALVMGEKLRAGHVLGATLGFLGSALVATNGGSFVVRPGSWVGYAAALACAVVWAGYSVASRTFAHVPTDAVGGYCAVTAVLAGACHFALEPTVKPDLRACATIALLGAGPLGAAFFMWDIGVKRGDLRTLGAMSYVGQVVSTLFLIALGRAAPSFSLIGGCVLVAGGAAIATSHAWRRGRTPAQGSPPLIEGESAVPRYPSSDG